MKRIARKAYLRALLPLARRARLEKAGSIYHLAAYYLRAAPVRGIVDGGAYLGDHARYLADLFPKSRVYAFEPLPASCEALRASLRRGSRIVPVSLALGAQSGVKQLRVNRFAPTSSLLMPAQTPEAIAVFQGREEEADSVEVGVTALDDFASETAGFRCDLLKLDLQGYELPALKGAERLLREQIRAVVSEVRFLPLYEGDAPFEELDRWLAARGFRLSAVGEITHHPTEGFACEANALWLRQM